VKLKLLLIAVLGIIIYFFIVEGLPMLNELKTMEKPTKEKPKLDLKGERPVTVDISIESICQNMITGAKNGKCNEEKCDATCEREGCKFFGLYYAGSTYNNSCKCNCLEQNKIQKALSQEQP